jgi:hypothetical protein
MTVCGRFGKTVTEYSGSDTIGSFKDSDTKFVQLGNRVPTDVVTVPIQPDRRGAANHLPFAMYALHTSHAR